MDEIQKSESDMLGILWLNWILQYGTLFLLSHCLKFKDGCDSTIDLEEENLEIGMEYKTVSGFAGPLVILDKVKVMTCTLFYPYCTCNCWALSIRMPQFL